jgi:hypothetical protein
MSEGDKKPPNPVVQEATKVDTYNVPEAFFE